jgi:hypothetical protein
MKPTIMLIKWVDSGLHIDHGWDTKEKYLEGIDSECTHVITTGFLMFEDDIHIILGQSYDPTHETWYGAQLIVKTNIVYPIDTWGQKTEEDEVVGAHT